MMSLRTRALSAVAAASLLLTSSLAVVDTPAFAQTGGSTGGPGCTQDATGGRAGGQQEFGRQDSRTFMAGVINAALSNTQLGVDALNLSGVNLSVVCLNDVLNGNHTQVLSEILNDSPILSHNRDVLSNNEVLKNFLNSNNIAANVEVISVDLGSGQIFLLRQ
jgi:hypothetical protein